MIQFEITHRGIQLGSLGSITFGTGCLCVDVFQRLNGYPHPLFLILGLISFGLGLLLYWKSHQEPPPRRKVNPAVYVFALLFAILCASPNFRIALQYGNFNEYLQIRAWLFTITSLVGIFYYAAFMMSVIKVRR